MKKFQLGNKLRSQETEMKMIFAAVCMLVLFAAPLFAEVDAIGRVKRTPSDIFCGAGFFLQSMSGTFNGDSVLRDEGEVQGIQIPKFEPGIGKSVMVGVRAYNIRFIGKNDVEAELSYNFADLTGSWNGQDVNASYQEIGAIFRSYFNPGKSFQPFLNLGVNQAAITVEDGITNTLEPADAQFTGFGFIGGGGIRVKITNNIGCDCAILEKFNPLYMVKGADKEQHTIKGTFYTSVVTVSASIKVYF